MKHHLQPLMIRLALVVTPQSMSAQIHPDINMEELFAVSQEGEGTCITIYLPRETGEVTS